MAEDGGRYRSRVSRQGGGTEMDFLRSSPAVDERALPCSWGARGVVRDSSGQVHGTVDGRWPFIQEGGGARWTWSMGSCEEGQEAAIGQGRRVCGGCWREEWSGVGGAGSGEGDGALPVNGTVATPRR